MSDTNRGSLAYVEEGTWAVDPGTGTKRTKLPITSESLAYDINYRKSATIRSDRQTTDLYATTGAVTGSINGELTYADWDDLIQGGMWASEWTSTPTSESLSDITVTGATSTYATAAGDFSDNNWVVGMWILVAGFTESVNNGWKQIATLSASSMTVVSSTTMTDEASGDSITITPPDKYVRNGTTENSYAFERAHSDITQFKQFLGCVINGMTISGAAEGPMEISFDVMGSSAESAQATYGDGSDTDVSGNKTISAVTNLGGILLDDSAVAQCLISRFSVNVNNNARHKKAVAVLGACDMGVGNCDVTGSIDMHFNDETYYDQYLAGTEWSYSFRLTDDDGNIMIVDMPRCQFNSNSGGQITGENSDTMENCGFQALRHATYDYTIQISCIDA